MSYLIACTSLMTAKHVLDKGTVKANSFGRFAGKLWRKNSPRKIRVNGINSGFVITEGTLSGGLAGGQFEETTVANMPLGRAGQPEDKIWLKEANLPNS